MHTWKGSQALAVCIHPPSYFLSIILLRMCYYKDAKMAASESNLAPRMKCIIILLHLFSPSPLPPPPLLLMGVCQFRSVRSRPLHPQKSKIHFVVSIFRIKNDMSPLLFITVAALLSSTVNAAATIRDLGEACVQHDDGNKYIQAGTSCDYKKCTVSFIFF